jgi:transcriptional regulator with XRE-family HTH domain
MAGPSLAGLLNPAVLVWARTSARVAPEVAARRAGVKVEKLVEWERGSATPTLNQLRSLANLYKRGVPVFFLREIPAATRQPVDYRRIELRQDGTMSTKLAVAIREASAKRDAALELFAELEEEPPEFALRAPAGTSAEGLAEFLTTRLNLPVEARVRSRPRA